MSLHDQVAEFTRLCQEGKTLTAIAQFYGEDVVVYENHDLTRAGRSAALDYERDALARMDEPARLTLRASAVDERAGIAFLEWRIRYLGEDGRPMRLDEVSVQRWSAGRIVEERFYYAGVVDEGDEE